MPDGKTHTTASVMLALTSSVAMLAKGVPTDIVIYGAAGCLSNVLLSPDLDIDSGYIGDGIVRKYLGGFIGWVWRTVWLPYSKVVKHRSVVSHFPVIGTVVRLFYLYFWYQAISMTINVALFFAGWSIPVYQMPLKEMLSAWAGTTLWTPVGADTYFFVLGLCTSDTLHAVMDVMSTGIKATRRKIHAYIHFPMSEVQNHGGR